MALVRLPRVAASTGLQTVGNIINNNTIINNRFLSVIVMLFRINDRVRPLIYYDEMWAGDIGVDTSRRKNYLNARTQMGRVHNI